MKIHIAYAEHKSVNFYQAKIFRINVVEENESNSLPIALSCTPCDFVTNQLISYTYISLLVYSTTKNGSRTHSKVIEVS
jgi:hypothetical protein